MVKNKLKINLFVILFFLLTSNLFANPATDQWSDTDKTYKDLIEEGFEVKGYAINKIESETGFTLILFVTVLQRKNDVYECQEYQTIDKTIETLDMQLICKQLVQPYERGLGT